MSNIEPVYKLYAILSATAVKAMNGNRGRMTVQAAHGYVHALWNSMDNFPDDAQAFRNQPSAFKVTLIAPDSDTLRALADHYKSICGVSLVEETGSKGDGSVNEAVRAITCVGIGPIPSDRVGDDLKGLKGFV